MDRLTGYLAKFYAAFLLLGGVIWASDLLLQLGISLIEPEWLGPYLGIGIALAFLRTPYGRAAGALEVLLGLVAIGAWSWMSINYQAWMLDIFGNTPDKWLVGVVALVLMQEGLRKSCGLPIALLVWVLIAYGLWGSVLPGPIQADRLSADELVMYLYTDTNGVPGFVLSIIASLVLAFIVFGKMMEVSGATRFFTELAMGWMGHRRGGPAKVAVAASAMLGSISSSPVSNIMSTGTVTIPLMRKTGFKSADAAAIEAVASTGGQIAPPVMGATAFLMAEFLQISYMEVALAAALPALFYYLCLFMQVDAVAARQGLHGIAREGLPRVWPLLKRGWVFVLPLAFLIYQMFWLGTSPASAALRSSVMLLVFALVQRRMLSWAEWRDVIIEGGMGMVPLVLIGAGAGVVVGVMSITGLGQSLSSALVQVAGGWGLLAMLAVTAVLCILLGMGMPSTAIYVVLASVVAPALVQMGVSAMAAHMFIFYFGVLSFLTPPVAVSSFVAAGLANANMWTTGWVGMRMAAVAYLIPFVWAYEPALLLEGSALAITVVTATTLSAVLLIACGIRLLRFDGVAGYLLALVLVGTVLAIGTAPVWLGSESILALGLAVALMPIYFLLPGGAGAPSAAGAANEPT